MLSDKLIPVKSTCFNASGYFGGRAAFRYRSGRVIYRNIPVELWQRFMGAKSKGRFFNAEIKKFFKNEDVKNRASFPASKAKSWPKFNSIKTKSTPTGEGAA